MKKCMWTEKDCWWKDEDLWSTNCGKEFMINEGSPLENGMVYCPYCGRIIWIERSK